MDMEMMNQFNSLERDEEGWKLLVHEANPKLELQKIHRTPGNNMAVLEVGWKSTGIQTNSSK
jgi:hypothetical protein